MQRYFLFVSFLFIFNLNSKAYFIDLVGIKSTLSGKVIDASTKKPLESATIIIHDIKITTISKKDGSFKTPAFQSGKYLVEVNYLGYASIIETIDFKGDVIKDFNLNETAVEQETVTVTGTTSATKIKNSPQPVSIVSSTDLFRNSSTNIIEALTSKVSGFSMITTGPAIAKPIIRGLGYNRMVTINDGIRQEGQQWGDEHGIEIDELSVQKVEVLKGPASLMYGSDAIAGVLNIITNKTIQEGFIKANLGSAYSDNNGLISSFVNIDGNLKNGFNFNVYRSTKSAADYQNKYDGKVFNSRFNEQNFGGYIGINKNWGYSHLLVSNFNQKLGLIDGTRDSASGAFVVFPESVDEHIATNDELNSRNLFVPYQHIQHFKIGLDNNFNLKKGRLTFNLAYQQNQRKEFGDYTTYNTPTLAFDLKTINYNLQYHFQEKAGWKTSLGVNGMWQTNLNKASEVLIPEYHQFDMGGFFITQKSWNKLTMSGGLRFDYRNLQTTELNELGIKRFEVLNKTFNNVSGSVGIAYNANDNVTLKLNIAKGFRAPSVTELSSNGAHEGTYRYEYGNKSLKSETSLQVDAGLELNSEHVSFSLNTFYNSFSNYIFYNRLNSVFGGDSIVNLANGEKFSAFQYSQANATLVGFEANLDFHPHPLDWLHIENSFSMVSGTFNQNIFNSKYLPFIPPARLLTELKVNFINKKNFFRNSSFKFEIDNTFAQNQIFSSFNTETTTPSYTLLNIGLGSDIQINKKQSVSLFLSVNNVADVAYQSHLSRLKYTEKNNATGRMGVFNMGRSINLKLNIPFSFGLK